MANVIEDVAIIGAGLGGMAFAIALSQRSIPCRIYERRNENSETFNSGVTLGPNGSRVLDSLGILQRIAPLSYQTETHTFKGPEGNTLNRINIATKELSEYKGHRIYRQILKQEFAAVLKELKIPVEYGAKFEKVVDESADGIAFLINDRVERASVLVGADGIHSTVRKYLTPARPEYVGLVCIYGHLPTDEVSCSPKKPIKHARSKMNPGFTYPALDRGGWEALAHEPDKLYNMFCKDYEQWGPAGRSIMDLLSTRKEGLLLWPFHRMPKLSSWASPAGRVIIIGDAAHAMPPSSGQGVNQALEDAFTLSVLLKSLSSKTNANEALRLWHERRQDRIDMTLKMAEETNVKRLPKAERLALEKRGPHSEQQRKILEDLKWLASPDMDEGTTN
ncbi:hypothetical protein AARAC_011271 [Aspergillus arachidicola]|uniref:FAD-binding domain-containing protein n=1 Tax=Aspergillus arachidicola TaxID=656916 RepID=A0A2G7G8A4_9EURO|nr:hypothetical protein AARAC_011271 [Aspergillus arachidicola]